MGATEPPVTAPSKRGLWLRLGLLVMLVMGGFFAVRLTPLGEVLTPERMIELFERLRQEPWAPAALIGLFTIATPLGLPSSPFLVGGGVVFGPVIGSIYNIVGLITGAMAAFWIGRALGRDALVQLAGPKLRRIERMFDKRGFWPLVQTRFLPIPFSLISYAAAVAGVSTGRFFITSLIGLVPATTMHTYFAPALILAMLRGEKPLSLMIQYGIAMAVLNIFASWPQLRRSRTRRRRFRELRDLRARRKGPPQG